MRYSHVLMASVFILASIASAQAADDALYAESCTPHYLDEYACNGFWRERLYMNSDCSLDWVAYHYCETGCFGTQCIVDCYPGLLDDYRCNGNVVERAYYDSDCLMKWRHYMNCEHGCADGACLDGCIPGYTGNYRCSGDWRQEEYQYADCGTQWVNLEYCSYGCTDGICSQHPDGYCTDSDGGRVYGVQGNTYGVTDAGSSYSKTDYCDGDVVYEYYCDGNDWGVALQTCQDTCADGRCVSDGCHDDCTYGEQECSGRYGYKVCGYYDSDVCTDWKVHQCDSSERCVSGGYCRPYDDDDCDPGYEDEYRCSGDWRQRLYVQSDCDEEWRNYDYCEDGCSNGRCVSGSNYCGDRVCRSGETCSSCPIDCGYCNYCGDRVCRSGETCSSCPIDCGNCNYCGNGVCGAGESCSTCPIDCGVCPPVVRCGDGVCSVTESCSSCQADCGACQVATCGDGLCSITESCSSCPTDCGICARCGDSLCDNGETCSTCSPDCGVCQVCGDGVCTGSENCTSCSTDCGACATQQPVNGTRGGTPTGAAVVAIDPVWVLIGLAALVNLVLLVILLKKI